MSKKYEEDDLPAYSRIDTILCVLDKSVICNYLEGKLNALPQKGSNLFISKPDKSILSFYTLSNHYFNQAWLPNFDFQIIQGN